MKEHITFSGDIIVELCQHKPKDFRLQTFENLVTISPHRLVWLKDQCKDAASFVRCDVHPDPDLISRYLRQRYL